MLERSLVLEPGDIAAVRRGMFSLLLSRALLITGAIVLPIGLLTAWLVRDQPLGSEFGAVLGALSIAFVVVVGAAWFAVHRTVARTLQVGASWSMHADATGVGVSTYPHQAVVDWARFERAERSRGAVLLKARDARGGWVIPGRAIDDSDLAALRAWIAGPNIG